MPIPIKIQVKPLIINTKLLRKKSKNTSHRKTNKLINQTPTEASLCKSFYKTVLELQKLCYFGFNFKLFKIPNEQFRANYKYTKHIMALGLVPGAPDYCIIIQGTPARVAFIEFKRNKKSKMAPSQEFFKLELSSLGAPFLCTSDINEAIDWIKNLK